MEELFNNIINDDEQILKIEKASKKGFILYSSFVNVLTVLCLAIWPIPIYILSIIPNMIYRSLASKNYYVCLTNKRLIIRHGAFTLSYDSYEIKNLGNVQCKQTIFDSSKENACNLIIDKKAFHMDEKSAAIWIDSIKNGYEVAKMINGVNKNNTDVSIKNSDKN